METKKVQSSTIATLFYLIFSVVHHFDTVNNFDMLETWCMRTSSMFLHSLASFLVHCSAKFGDHL